MSYEQPNFSLGEYKLDFDASNLALNQYTVVTLGSASNNGSGTGEGNARLKRCTAGQRPLGLIQSNGIAGEAVSVMVEGLSMGRISPNAAGGPVYKELTYEVSTGMLKEAAAGDFIVGLAHEAYEPGDITTVRLGNFGKL